jgi:PhoPQ-activated pathogenicity-related protein
MPRLPRRLVLSAALLAALAAPLGALLLGPAAPAARAEGAKSHAALFAKDDAFKWEVVSTSPVPGGTQHLLKLTSQVWQGIPWTHWLRVIEPESAPRGDAALLIIGGGRNRDRAPGDLKGEALMLPLLAAETGSIVALLEQVPNQPLYDGLTEDRLVAHTFKKYLETEDPSWPALVPMVKSALRSMDAIQELTQGREGKKKVERFFVTGASKRGWTTWLSAAHDERVCGIAPMVIDVVNMAKQMPHQVEYFGTYSEKIDPYVQLGLPQKVQGPEAKDLLTIVDPWTHRERLTLPKLIVLGTNDPYWTVDAVDLYFGGLEGEKYVSYVPNAGHGLGPAAYQTASAYYQQVLDGTPRPRFGWERRLVESGNASGARAALFEVEARCTDLPSEVTLFTATSRTRDFRPARWEGRPVAPLAEGGPGRYVASVEVPEEGYVGSYLSLTYKDAKGRPMTLCTTIEIAGEGGRFRGPSVGAQSLGGASGAAATPAAKPAPAAPAVPAQDAPGLGRRREF